MSYIPDCRNDEYYNQKYLNEKDGEFVRGFDWCAEKAVDVFFDNLEAYFATDAYLMHMLNEEMPKEMHDEYDWQDSFDGTGEKRIVRTYLDALRAHLIDWMESSRDELITSMIDSMEEDEYKSIKDKIDGSGAE